ncbi:methylthioribose-1-phosphate isomerase [bacterium BMS3Abin02]|nr:methylthioribose-1-phosphate isomerase [bacterium BMS3Abin02]
MNHPITPIRWAENRTGLVILDQTLLPAEQREIRLDTLEKIEEAIISLRVRGAPLIGITAAMGIATLANQAAGHLDQADLAGAVHEWADRLAVTRPTAVNLTWAIDRMRSVVSRRPDDLARALTDEAIAIYDEDRATCQRIGEHGLTLLRDGATVHTHCNAGALATGGIGTALAPIYLAHERAWSIHVYADETRPLLQGSRLTAWELDQAGIDVTVITDSMAGALFSRRPPDVVFVGADRIAANGDVANKIGTYALAVLAHHHGIPFYSFAPTSTIDAATPTGEEIRIEQRSPDEIRRGFGTLTAPETIDVWNPAFDVTPAALITGIVTELGIATPPFEQTLP